MPAAAASSAFDRGPNNGLTDLGPEVLCFVCHRATAVEEMKLLHCYPNQHRDRSSQCGSVMHFPFLKTLPLPSGPLPSYFDSQNRTLVCSDCFGHFNHQWNVFESAGLSLELRPYTLPPAAHRVSCFPFFYATQDGRVRATFGFCFAAVPAATTWCCTCPT